MTAAELTSTSSRPSSAATAAGSARGRLGIGQVGGKAGGLAARPPDIVPEPSAPATEAL